MSDGREHAVAIMGQVDRVVSTEGHALNTISVLHSFQQRLCLQILLSLVKAGPLLGLWREELLHVDGCHGARYD